MVMLLCEFDGLGMKYGCTFGYSGSVYYAVTYCSGLGYTGSVYDLEKQVLFFFFFWLSISEDCSSRLGMVSCLSVIYTGFVSDSL